MNAFTITPEAVKEEQQAMIQACEDAGIKRKALAEALCVCYNYITQVMSTKNMTRFTTEQDLMLRAICAELGHYEFLQRLIVSGKALVSRVPDLPTNGDTTDELLDGLRALGDAAKVCLKKNPRAVHYLGEQIRDVGLRLMKESIPDDVDFSDAVMAQSIPLFEDLAA